MADAPNAERTPHPRYKEQKEQKKQKDTPKKNITITATYSSMHAHLSSYSQYAVSLPSATHASMSAVLPSMPGAQRATWPWIPTPGVSPW